MSETTIDLHELGTRLREAREGSGMSRMKLAKVTGIPHKAIEKFEYGTQEPSVSRLRTLCKHLDLDMSQFTGEEPIEAEEEDDEVSIEPAYHREVNNVHLPRLHRPDSGKTSHAPAPAPPDITDLGQVEDMLHELDNMREDRFQDAMRRALATANHTKHLVTYLEPDELVTLARERSLNRTNTPSTRELLDKLEDDFEVGQKTCNEIGLRLIDTAILGVDLYSLPPTRLTTLADKLVEEEKIEDHSSLFGNWGKPSEFIPYLRANLWQMAVTGRGPDFHGGKTT